MPECAIPAWMRARQAEPTLLEAWMARVNPIHPFTWAAHYRDHAVLSQFDRTGYHRTSQIRLGDLQRLVVTGPVRWRLTLAVQPGADEVCLYATREIERAVPMAQDLRGWTLRRRLVSYTFAVRYGCDLVGMRLYPACGRIEWLNLAPITTRWRA